MDALLAPSDPTLPSQRARFVCTQKWDGGDFLLYARRQGRMRTVPVKLRQYLPPTAPGVPGDAKAGVVATEADDEFTEHIHPTPHAEQEAFLQTWLYFGLLAEFFGLNKNENGDRLVDDETAQAELDALYREYVEEYDEGGVSKKYITIGPMVRATKAPLTIVARLRLSGPGIEKRIRYLHRCLKFSCFLLNTATHSPFDPAIKTSIAALGELLSTAFATAATLKRIPDANVTFSFAWADRFLEDGSDLERQMVAHGWCPSEVAKIRAVHQGLGTRHYLSLMRKGGPPHDHRQCSHEGCGAFQIDAAKYQPAHARNGCTCALTSVDVPCVLRILHDTPSFPVLRVRVTSPSVGTADAVEMDVEEHKKGVPYVAISHVWADGMGNPFANSLPVCQIAKVARLVSDLETATRKVEPDDDNSSTYRLWIDPLLCPMEAEGKNISLQRISDVYRNAAHVLVLDASLMHYLANKLPPEELLLRIFSSSAWMRRLWTLQEGALAQSLYFQFADRAVTPNEPLEALYRKGLLDSRYMRLWQDIAIEQIHLRGWFQNVGGPLSLISLQRTLHFRTVSNPADEPLCIATLLGLDQTKVVAISDAQERMACVWGLIASKLGGGVPARILFSSDATLDVPGWRWVPRSLLGASHAAKESMMDVNHRIMRFRSWRETHREAKPGIEIPSKSSDNSMGVPTPWGLRVRMGGFILSSSPLLPDLPLHPWENVAGAREDMVLAKHMPSGRWLRLMDFYRLEKNRKWAANERREYDRHTNNPLCQLIDSGRQALLCDTSLQEGNHHQSLMVQLKDGWHQPNGTGLRRTLRAHRERVLILDWATPAQTTVAEGLQQLAETVAKDEATTHLLQSMDSMPVQEEGKEALDRVKALMKTAMAEKWKTDAAFVEAVRDTRGPGMEHLMWAEIQMRFSHNITCHDVPESQVWLVD
ncbi:hypothetical protein SBRCBS47491_006240 [Sporothrix bragantina]|uniref:Heterokaryon incompatibility domain-containing protein n=1 Tax=Sporothrix bragantina TaxID=671064 RepID=A0ABP0C3A8_9PEZI